MRANKRANIFIRLVAIMFCLISVEENHWKLSNVKRMNIFFSTRFCLFLYIRISFPGFVVIIFAEKRGRGRNGDGDEDDSNRNGKRWRNFSCQYSSQVQATK